MNCDISNVFEKDKLESMQTDFACRLRAGESFALDTPHEVLDACHRRNIHVGISGMWSLMSRAGIHGELDHVPGMVSSSSSLVLSCVISTPV